MSGRATIAELPGLQEGSQEEEPKVTREDQVTSP